MLENTGAFARQPTDALSEHKQYNVFDKEQKKTIMLRNSDMKFIKAGQHAPS